MSFFPDAYQGSAAREICLGCDVQPECLRYAVRTNQQYGIWGGMSFSQRNKYRRNRNAEEQANQT